MAGKDLRKHIRILALNLVSYTRFDHEGQLEETSLGRTLDISRGGMQLEVENRYPLSSEFEIRLQIYEDIIILRGKVVHVEELRNGSMGLGIKFTKVAPEVREIIDQFLTPKG